MLRSARSSATGLYLKILLLLVGFSGATRASRWSQVHQEYRCVGHGVACVNRSIRHVTTYYEAITSAASGIADVHPNPGRADRRCPKHSIFLDFHDTYCTVKATITTTAIHATYWWPCRTWQPCAPSRQQPSQQTLLLQTLQNNNSAINFLRASGPASLPRAITDAGRKALQARSRMQVPHFETAARSMREFSTKVSGK